MAPQTDVKGDELFGIAKKMNRELEELPLHTHSAIVEALRVSVQHRQIGMQRAEHERTMDLNERNMKAQEQHLALQQAAQDRAAAAETKAAAAGIAAGPALVAN